MDAERLKQIEEIYHAALEITPEKRASFFKEHCGTDEDLRREVESLLVVETNSGGFLDTPPESLAAAMFSEKQTSLVDEEIGHYKIKELLGTGGMGEVYLAEDMRLHRQVALKILHENVAADAERLRRFGHEARAASALNHPNIMTVHEFGTSGGVHFLATEYVEGKTLREAIKGGQLTLIDALKIAEQAASALSAAHEAGIVHRDIKPDNIMLRPDGYVKVLDFGIAKLTENRKAVHWTDSESPTREHFKTNPGEVMGTADYMSPEQARGKDVDSRADIFSLGVVLYEMLTGQRPFAGENAMDSIGAILHKEPTPINQLLPELPTEIEQIVNKTLRKDRNERYQTAKDLLTDLRRNRQRLEFEAELAAGRGKRIREAIALAGKDESDLKFAQVSAAHTTDSTRSGSTIFQATDATEEPHADTSAATAEHSVSSAKYIAGEVKKHKLAWLGALAVFTVALAAIGYWTYFRSPAINSIAVLPFVNVGDTGDGELLSDGLSENLINTLSRLPQLKVIARSSSFKYRGENVDIQDAAQKLGVGAILTGRVARRGDDLQISVELINAADNTRIWGDTYNRKVSASLDLPKEIAQAVSEKLQLKLSGLQERQIAKRVTNNPQAYQLYLNGVLYRRKNGAENLRKAIEYQNQAIALDANFALAYVELAINFANLTEIGSLSPQEGMSPARSAAEKALALDETLADAHYNIARIKKSEFDWAGAESSFRRAIELNPNLAAAHTIYAEYLSQLGRFDEALREIRLAQELDPLRVGLIGNEGNILYYARRFDEAIAKMQDGLKPEPENAPARIFLGQAYAAAGQYENAVREFQTAYQTDDQTTGALLHLGRTYALSGRRDEATAILNELKTTKKYVSPAVLAIFYAGLGDKEAAFKSFEHAYAERDFQLQFLKVEPGYDSLREDPRYKEMLKRLNLLE